MANPEINSEIDKFTSKLPVEKCQGCGQYFQDGTSEGSCPKCEGGSFLLIRASVNTFIHMMLAKNKTLLTKAEAIEYLGKNGADIEQGLEYCNGLGQTVYSISDLDRFINR